MGLSQFYLHFSYSLSLGETIIYSCVGTSSGFFNKPNNLLNGAVLRVTTSVFLKSLDLYMLELDK